MSIRNPDLSRRDLAKKSLAMVAAGIAGASLLGNEAKAADPNSMAIIVTSGSLDTAYSHFRLASTAVAMGLDVTMFFTSQGLPLLLKDMNLYFASLSDPASGLTMFQTKKDAWAALEEIRELVIETNVRMIGCQMTLDLFGYLLDDIIEGIEIGGMATYVEVATQSHINLQF